MYSVLEKELENHTKIFETFDISHASESFSVVERNSVHQNDRVSSDTHRSVERNSNILDECKKKISPCYHCTSEEEEYPAR